MPRVPSVASMTAKETDMSTEFGYDVFITEPVSQNVT
jgi:hypothetical protein